MSKRNKIVTVKPKVDIIIPVYGRIDLLKDCLFVLPYAFEGVEYNVIIFDNGTPINEKKFYATLPKDKFTIIESKENLGFPVACNKAASRGFAPYLFFLNSDVVLDPHAGTIMYETLDKDQTIGVVGAKLIFPEQTRGLNTQIRPAGKIQHVGLMTNIRGDISHAFIGWSEDNPKISKVRDVLAVTGAALMTRRTLWNRFGGFYAGYGLGTYEDVDYCMKSREAGFNVIVNVNARGIHYTSASAETYKIGYPMQMNKLIFLQRWLGKLPWTEWNHW